MSNSKPKTKYGTTKFVCNLFVLFGLFIVFAGCLLLYAPHMAGGGFVALAVALAVMSFGAIFIVSGQLALAMVDSADNTRNILEFLQQSKEQG